MIEQRQYTKLAATLAQFSAWLADRASNPFESGGVCIACGATSPHHVTDCIVARALHLSSQIRLIGQWVVDNRTVSMFAVMGKRNYEAGTLFMYNVNAIVTGASLRPHTTCSCGHCKPTELCDHAMRVEAYLRIVGKAIANATTDAKPSAPISAVPGTEIYDEPPMPEMRPPDDGDFVPGENFSPERLAELQKIVGGGPTPEMPFDTATGKCGKCGGVWGHEMDCGWA